MQSQHVAPDKSRADILELFAGKARITEAFSRRKGAALQPRDLELGDPPAGRCDCGGGPGAAEVDMGSTAVHSLVFVRPAQLQSLGAETESAPRSGVPAVPGQVAGTST